MEQRDSVRGTGGRSIHLQINEANGTKLSEIRSSNTINFVTQNMDSSNFSPDSTAKSAPEKKLTLFALRLAVLEKTAKCIGTLGFIWATTVLLGGFAITLDETDFWFVTTILLLEGTRIFSRSHELKWQHEEATWKVFVRKVRASLRPAIAPWNPTDEYDGVNGERRKLKAPIRKGNNRAWTSSEVPILPYPPKVFLASTVSRLLSWLQLGSATACVVIYMLNLANHNYGDVPKKDTNERNRKAAMNIFYALALADALLFLLEKAYWEWKVNYWKLFEVVNKETDLGPSGLVSVRRFFYDAYSKCINGSIFDGIKMDLVSFAMDMLTSKSPDEQLIGAQILEKFATNDLFSYDTLQKFGMSTSVMGRLVEMLNWKDAQEEEIRRLAAVILSKLASKRQKSLRLAGIPGVMESISSLLTSDAYDDFSGLSDEISDKEMTIDNEEYGSCIFKLLGLRILKKLARDHGNCRKIGNTCGLLPKIIDFTQVGTRLLKDDNVSSSQILRVKQSLQVIKRLSNTTGTTGKQLRKQISEVVLTIGNIRDILRHGDKQPTLQKLGSEILTNLAQEENTKERIGSTGGVLKELSNIFLKEGMPENQSHVRVAAGEALSMLSLQSADNCHHLLKLNVTKKLIGALKIPLLRVNAAQILRNLCTYGRLNYSEQMRETTAAAPTVLRAIMREENKLQEVMVGLAPQIFILMSSQELSTMFERAEIQEIALATKLVHILKTYQYPSTKVPRIRRFVIELTIWMMRYIETNIQVFKNLGMEKELDNVIETTSELENFIIFSGTVGLSRQATTIGSLVETAMQLLVNK